MTTPDTKSAAPIARSLAGQKALVTGANSGIGRAVAIALGQAGADVVVNYVAGEDRAQEVVRAIEQHGVKAYAHLADVSDETQVRDMFGTMVQRLGTIDILVNNAGLQRDAPLQEMTLAQWNTVISVNLTGQFLCSRAAIVEFLRRGLRPEVSSSAGKIICMSSVHQEIPWAGHCNYAASKGGIMMLMKSIAQEFAPRRIRINPLGHIQMLGKSHGATIAAEAGSWARLMPEMPFDAIAHHAVDFWLTSEDLPDPNNRIRYDRAGRVILDLTENNMEGHRRLQAKLKGMLDSLDLHPHLLPRSLYLGKNIPIGGTAHQAGTIRFGRDPRTS